MNKRVVAAFAQAFEESPADVANALVDHDPTLASSLASLLERQLGLKPLERAQRVLQLSSSQAAELFGVSRQAYAKWQMTGVPAERQDDVDHLNAVTQVLVDHVRVERIPAVVRRPAETLQGASVIEYGQLNGLAALEHAVRESLDIRTLQP